VASALLAAFLPELPVLPFFELPDLEFGVRFNPSVAEARLLAVVREVLIVLVELLVAAVFFFAAGFFGGFFAPPLPRPTKSAIFEMMPGLSAAPFLLALFASELGTG